MSDARTQMNAMYAMTRHIYDASRKYYLLGRDKLIQQLDAKPDETICEVGCGTARNLKYMAKKYNDSKFFGIDASDEMLKTAHKSLTKHDLLGRVTLKQAYAQNFDPVTLFGLNKPLDKIVFSYSLSIIPPWQESLDHAVKILPSGGEIHIVDFGDMGDIQPIFRKIIYWWLSLFHVYYKPEIEAHLKELEKSGQGTLTFTSHFGGYAYLAKFMKA